MENSITSDASYVCVGQAPGDGNTMSENCRHTSESSCEVCAQLREACSEENELGRGAFGFVHRVGHAGEQYAIKVMRCSVVGVEGSAQQEAFSNSTRQEVHASAHLFDLAAITACDDNSDKRHLVSIRDVCVRNALEPVVVMELCGENLSKCIKAVVKHKKDCEKSGSGGGGWTLAHTRNVAQHVAKGISYLQSHELVHCDLKMGNVVASTSVAELLASLCGGGGGCQQVCTEAGADDVFFKLCDYGQVTHMTQWRSGQGGGTPGAREPLQAQIEPGVLADVCKVDVYSLGIIVMGMFVSSDTRGTTAEERQQVLDTAVSCLAARPSERLDIAALGGDFTEAKAWLEQQRRELLPQVMRELIDELHSLGQRMAGVEQQVAAVAQQLLPPSIEAVRDELRVKYGAQPHRFFASREGADERRLIDMHIERLVIRSRQVPGGDGADGGGGIEGGGSVSAARMWRISKSGSLAAVAAGGSTAKDFFRRVLIEGEAGIGKSTYLRYLAETQNFGEDRWRDVDVVFYVSLDMLRTLMSREAAHVDVRVEHAVAVCLGRAATDEMVTGVAKTIATGGLAVERIVWLFDGYDEVHTERGKDTAFGKFVAQLASNSVPWVDRCVMSSRAERGTGKFVDCVTLQLQKFSHENVRQFVGERYPWPTGSEQRKALLLQHLQARGDLIELMTVPLMCDLVCYVYSSDDGAVDGGELRVESVGSLLDHCYELMLKRAVHRPGLRSEHAVDADAVEALDETDAGECALGSLEKLAWQCCQEHSLEVELCVDDALIVLEDASGGARRRKEAQQRRRERMKALVQQNMEASGFVVATGDGKKHRFFHALIRDYLASRYLFDNWEAVHGGAAVDPAE